MTFLAGWCLVVVGILIGWCLRVSFERMGSDPYRDLPDTLRSHRSRQRELGLRPFDNDRAFRTLTEN